MHCSDQVQSPWDTPLFTIGKKRQYLSVDRRDQASTSRDLVGLPTKSRGSSNPVVDVRGNRGSQAKVTGMLRRTSDIARVARSIHFKVRNNGHLLYPDKIYRAVDKGGMIVFLLMFIVLLLLLRRRTESFKNPSELTNEEFQALLETPTGKKLKAELVKSLTAQGAQPAGIPDYINRTIKQTLNQSSTIYNQLEDKTQFNKRVEDILLSEQSIKIGGLSLQQAYFEFVKNYFATAPSTAPQSTEIAREAGTPPVVERTTLANLLETVKDDSLRDMLNKYSKHMVSYYTTGEVAYKQAADLALSGFRKHVNELDEKVKKDNDRINTFIKEYDPENADLESLRSELREITRTGDALENQYETQKRLNENVPEPSNSHAGIKAGLAVGVLIIGFVAKSFIERG
jgi:hypothetical protein